MSLRLLDSRPVVAAILGAVCIAFSAILFRYSGVSPSTGAFYRCAWALPLLLLLGRREDRRLGPRPREARRWAVLAGLFFAADLILWHHAIDAVGAGLSTVLANTQVVLVGAVAWLVLGERPAARALAAIPVAFGGVVLISGVAGSDAYGSNPPLGVLFGLLTGLMYTGFLLALRRGNEDVRRPAGPLFDATLVAALACAGAGAALGELDLTPSLRALGWLILLALTSQVLGWLLISLSLPRLPALLTSLVLTLQPVGSVGLAALLLGESPSPVQLAGVGAILVGLLIASSGRRASAGDEGPAPAGTRDGRVAPARR